MPVNFAKTTHMGLVRRSNEDSFFAQPPVFMVADGMGGAQAGEVASGMAAGAFTSFVPQTLSPQEELAVLIQDINIKIYESAGGDAKQSGMGTTITAAVIADKTVGFAHVGDSRAYLWRAGKLRQLTEDHSLVGEMLRQGKITDDEALSHPQRSIITRALGVDSFVEIDTDTVLWKPGDIFLLCSDGLHSMISDEEIAAVIGREEKLGAIADELVEAALAAGGADNVTVVLFSPDGSRTVAGEGPSAKLAAPVLEGSGPEGGAADEVAPAQTAAAGKHRRTFREWFSSVPGRIVTGLLIAAVLLASAWFATRQFYYVGVDGGRVSIFRGVPYDLGPWHLSSLYSSSPVKFEELEPFEQERVAKQDLKSRGEAESMVENYKVDARIRKEEAEKKAREDAERSKTTAPNIIPPGAL